MSLKHRWQAWQELMQRYRAIWGRAWQQRKTLTMPKLTADEAEFLPAALSLQAKPVSPVGRWMARVLMGLVAAVLLWACLGHLDIIVNGTGKIIAAGYTKTISAAEIGRVQKIHVEEGQFVKAGDALLELDTGQVDSDHDRAEADRQMALAQAARCRALLQALEANQAPVMEAVPDIDSAHWNAAEHYLQDQWRAYIAQRARLDGEIARYGASLPAARRIETNYAELVKTGDVAQNAWLEKQQARIDIEGQLTQAKNQRASLTADTREKAREQLDTANKQAIESAQDVRKARAHGSLLILTAPVDGTVQQLTVHTVGAAVPAAQPLMQIVPQHPTVEFEASIADRDVGFVHEGQRATVKIDAFEYTRYGTVQAVVSQVSHDAIQDDKKGLLYAVKVTLDNPELLIDGQSVKLTPGMSGTVDIRTGTRRVISYVLSPLIQAGKESLRER